MGIIEPNILAVSGGNVTKTFQKCHRCSHLSEFLKCCCMVGKGKCFIILADVDKILGLSDCLSIANSALYIQLEF